MSSTSPLLHIQSVIFFFPNVFYFSSFAYSECYFFSSQMSSTSPHLHIRAVIFTSKISSTSPHLHIRAVIFFLPKCLLLLLICIFRVLFFFFPNVFYFSSFAYSGCYFFSSKMSSTSPHLHIQGVIFFLPKCLLLLLICIFGVLFFFFPNVFYFSSFAYSECYFFSS